MLYLALDWIGQLKTRQCTDKFMRLTVRIKKIICNDNLPAQLCFHVMYKSGAPGIFHDDIYIFNYRCTGNRLLTFSCARVCARAVPYSMCTSLLKQLVEVLSRALQKILVYFFKGGNVS